MIAVPAVIAGSPSSAAVRSDQAFRTGSDQVFPVCFDERFFYQFIVGRILILYQCSLHCLFMRVVSDMYLLHRQRVDSGVIHAGRYRTRGRIVILYLAGIYRPYGEENRFVILTREANASMLPVHDRMPLILSRGEVGPWVRGVNEADDILAKKLPLLRAERPYEQMTFEG